MAKKKLVGRPSLGVRSTNIRLTEAQRDLIRTQVGDRGLAQYIRDAIDEKLSRDRMSTNRKKP